MVLDAAVAMMFWLAIALAIVLVLCDVIEFIKRRVGIG